MRQFQLDDYRPFTIETIIKMYEDIQGFEKKDFMEGEWRSYIEFVQYAAPFYITYHCFPEIFHAIEALAKLFIEAELVFSIVERCTPWLINTIGRMMSQDLLMR